MDIKQLVTFVTLSDTRNYRKAAEQLQYTRSTLFKHIQVLEQELGVALVNRDCKQVELTREGERFLAHARKMVADYRAAVDSVTAAQSGYSLTIGGCEMNMAYSLFYPLSAFSQNHPQVSMSMLTSPNASVPELVRNEMLDVGFYYSTQSKHCASLESVCLYREPLYLISTPNHPLASRAHLRYDDIAGEHIVYPHESCCFIVDLLQTLEDRRIKVNTVSYLGSIPLVMERMKQTNALMFAPHCAISRLKERYDIAVLDVCEEPVTAWEMMIYPKKRQTKPVVSLLATHCLRAAKLVIEREQPAIVAP